MISPHILFPWKSFLWRIVVPTILAFTLFIAVIFAFIIPTIEKSSLERKREMIQELTTSAWNILAKLENDERQGLLTRAEAQGQAIDQIKSLHYGQAVKDYFWINDMHPRMVIHPYRTDLNGKDLSDYRDPDGKRVFVEFVNMVKRHGSGFVNYKWQSYDNRNLVLPKISYVKGFKPWGWVIGTGIYIEDIKTEIAAITNQIIKFSVIILILILLLLSSIISISYKTHQQQRAAEEELKSTRENLVLTEKMASLGRLSAMVAHEINNPLSGILSYAKLSAKYLAQESLKPDTVAETRENLTLIASEAKRCGDIVKNLLLFAKRTMGEVKEEHLNEIIKVGIKVIDHSARMKNLELSAEFDTGDDLIQCDAGSIQQILVSLIVNAIEASSPGKKIIIRTDYRKKDAVKIKLIDFGAGIPEDVLPHIFDPFFSTKGSNKSLGLGLSAVYGIVQRHGGLISVDSCIGRGTEFTIKLPRVQIPQPMETH